MKQTKNGERQHAFSRAALANVAENFAGLDIYRNVAKDTGFVAVINGEPEGQKWGRLDHFCAPNVGSGPRWRTSAFQKAWGSRTEGAEPRTAGEIADMASLLTR